MASCSPIKSEFITNSQDNLDCSICCMRFKKPKLLDCLHCFCFKCIQELRRYKDSGNTKISCPVCREETTLKENNVANLPNNFSLSALVEVAMQEQLLKGQESEIMCQACEEENQAISRCMDCVYFLCQKCQNAHERWEAMKSHKIYTLAQLQSGEIAYKSKIREYIPKCHKHSDQNLSVYCYTCEQLACTVCMVLCHGKPEHTLVDLKTASEKCKQDVEKLVAKVEKNKNKFDNAIKEIEESHKHLDHEFASETEKISTKADEEVGKLTEEITRIREEEMQMKQKVRNIYQDRIKTFQEEKARQRKEMGKADDKLKEVNQLMEQASCYEIIYLRQKLLHNLEELTQRLPNRRREYKETYGEDKDKETKEAEEYDEDGEEGDEYEEIEDEEFKEAGEDEDEDEEEEEFEEIKELEDDEDEEDEEDIESNFFHRFVNDELKAKVKESQKHVKLCAKEKWNMKKEIKEVGELNGNIEFAYDIAVNTTNRIIVTDIGRRRFITFLISSKYSPVALRSQRIPGLNRVTHVTVNAEDQLIILDHDTVKTFNSSFSPYFYNHLNQFKAYEVSKCKPSCLASDDENQIAVGYKGKGLVSLHNPDGSLIKRLPAPMIGRFMTIYKQHLIYSSYDNKKLISVDYNGQMVFSVDIICDLPGLWGPSGVCCDTDGSIYVAVWTELSGRGEIHHFSTDGEFISCAIKDCDSPYGIAIKPDGDLIVAAETSIKIYNRVDHFFL